MVSGFSFGDMSGTFTRIRVVFDDSVEVADPSIRKAVVWVPQTTQTVSDLEHLVRDQYGINHHVKLELEGGFYIKPTQSVWFVVKETDVLMYVIPTCQVTCFALTNNFFFL